MISCLFALSYFNKMEGRQGFKKDLKEKQYQEQSTICSVD